MPPALTGVLPRGAQRIQCSTLIAASIIHLSWVTAAEHGPSRKEGRQSVWRGNDGEALILVGRHAGCAGRMCGASATLKTVLAPKKSASPFRKVGAYILDAVASALC